MVELNRVHILFDSYPEELLDILSVTYWELLFQTFNKFIREFFVTSGDYYVIHMRNRMYNKPIIMIDKKGRTGP